MRRFRITERTLFALHVSLVLFIALVVRLAYWSDARAYRIGGDEQDYVIPAQTLVRDGQYIDTFVSRGHQWTRVPLTQLFFAGSFLFVPDGASASAEGDEAAPMQPRYDALNLAQIAVSLVTVALTMLFAGRAFPTRSRRVALIAGYISALYPPLASSPAQRALSEPLSITLILAALYVLSLWSPEMARRRSMAVAAGVGVLFGIATLARSVAIGFLPFAWLWMLVVYRSAQKREIGAEPAGSSSRRFNLLGWLRERQKPLLGGAVATLACLLAIAPWTYYNYLQYRSFLLLETANATAYWNYHNFRGEDYNARLSELPNPADRLSMIIREGTANIIEYPDKALRSAIFAFGYFWHLESNSAVLLNSWDMTQRDPDVPDLLHSDAVFLLVGLLGMAGLAGVGLRRPSDDAGRVLLLLNLWLLFMVLLGIVVPYDGRYRLPAAPSLIVLAAGLLALVDWRTVFRPRRAWAALRHHPVVALVTFVLSLWVLIGAYTPNIPPLLRSIYQSWRGDIALQSGNAVEAFGRYGLAQAAFPSFYWPYRHEADEARGLGREDEARTLYAQSYERNRDDPYSILGFADLYARHPDWDLTDAEREWLHRDEEEWRGNPWNSFTPSPITSIDVGSGGDIPYVRGFYRPDQAPDFDYRWSQGRATIRIPTPSGSTFDALTLRMSAPALGPPEAMPVSVLINGATPVKLEVPAGWADYEVQLPGGKVVGGGTIFIEIESPRRSPALLQPGSNDPRNLGVGIDRITLDDGRRTTDDRR
ncbi:MAG TPA: hypothetical protein VJ183_09055 [Chloroflexia bacterium]|nr:hypothetical protein [Chloroflexia bacterium]